LLKTQLQQLHEQSDTLCQVRQENGEICTEMSTLKDIKAANEVLLPKTAALVKIGGRPVESLCHLKTEELASNTLLCMKAPSDQEVAGMYTKHLTFLVRLYCICTCTNNSIWHAFLIAQYCRGGASGWRQAAQHMLHSRVGRTSTNQRMS
jgi:hypothetical protein